MVRFELTFTNISFTISQHIHFITPIFRVLHISHNPTFPYYVFNVLVFELLYWFQNVI